MVLDYLIQPTHPFLRALLQCSSPRLWFLTCAPTCHSPVCFPSPASCQTAAHLWSWLHRNRLTPALIGRTGGRVGDWQTCKKMTHSGWKRGLTCFSVEKFLFAVHAEWVIVGKAELDVTQRSCFQRRPGPCRAAALSEHPRQPDGSPATRTARYSQ